MRKFMMLLVLAAALAPTASQARGRAQMEGLSLFGVFGYGPFYETFGVGARYAFPLADGVVTSSSVHDEFALELGADLLFDDYGATVAPAAGFAWNFWFLDDALALYPKLDLGWYIYTGDRDGPDYVGFDLGLGGGVMFRPKNTDLTFRLEGTQHVTRLGVAFGF